MLYIIKGLWLHWKAKKYSSLVQRCTEERTKLKAKQAKYSGKCEKYQNLSKQHKG